MRSYLSVSALLKFVFAILLVYMSGKAIGAEPIAKITVEAGKYTRIDTVVSVELEGISSADALHLVEILPSGTKPVAAQIEPGQPPRLWWILSGTIPAESKRYYELVKGCDVKTTEVKAIKNDSFLQLQVNDANVLRYNHAIVPAPNDLGRKVKEEQRRLYDRSGFIHPLWSPSGNVMTDIHPADHIHHYGIWMPWTKTEFEGQEVDFWNVGRGLGTVRFVKFLSTTSGPVYGGFQAEQEHVALKTSEGEKVVLKEVWDVRAYNIGGPEKKYYLIDFKSTQRCVADSPLRQVEYRYGGFGFRGAREWKDESAAYLTSEGKTREDGHGTRARWCDMAGAIEGKWTGVTIMSHPKNFRHPEPMRIWPPEDKFVFFNFAPSQIGDWEMKPGEDHIFRYRLYVHEGKINVADAERIWNDYAEPPTVKLEKVKKDNEKDRPSVDTKWQDLFDGESLTGWTQRGGRARYHVEDGAIVGTTVPYTPNSFLCTDKMYSDFILELDFKVDPNLNSGVQIRSNSIKEYKKGQVHGYQVEIDHRTERAWTGGIYDEGRRGWLYDLKDNEAARKAYKNGQWNHFRIEAVGDSIKTWLNGVAAADLKDSMTRVGFIALQVHSTKSKEPLQVRWRNIRIQELGSSPDKPL